MLNGINTRDTVFSIRIVFFQTVATIVLSYKACGMLQHCHTSLPGKI